MFILRYNKKLKFQTLENDKTPIILINEDEEDKEKDDEEERIA